jgi:hypothetical protein
MPTFKGPSLKPTELGLGGNYSTVTAYKRAVISSIDERIDQFNMVHPDYAPYLKHLVNNAGSSRTFPGYAALKRVLENTPTGDSKSSLKEIEKYFAEVVGPISLVEDTRVSGKTTFTESSSVGVPNSVSQSGYDFSVNGTEVTVKMPTGKTNTLKPGDIVGNKEFVSLVNKSGNNIFKEILGLMKVLNSNSAKLGPYIAIYGEGGRGNGVLSELVGKRKEQDSVLIPGNSTELPEKMISFYANALEKQIEIWSKSNRINSALIEFTNLYYNTKQLFAFSYKIESNGNGKPKFSNAVKGASIVGKGRAGPFGSDSNGDMTLNQTKEKPEKIGIQMTF